MCLPCLVLSAYTYMTSGFQTEHSLVRINVATSYTTHFDTSVMMSTESDMEGKRGMKGYYRRPSRAIEKGGGFFVPGLEGEKIRVLSAAVLVFMIASNRAGVADATIAQVTSEVIGMVMAIILFVQGVAEAFPSIGTSSSVAAASTTPVSNFLSVIQAASKSSQIIAVETAARSIIQTCEDRSEERRVGKECSS